MEVVLRRWWADKYKKPSTHRLFQEAVLFDLLVEYYEDLYDDDSVAALDAIRGEDGEVVFEETGDPLLDKWERELAAGLTPDLEEGFSDAAREQLNRQKAKFAQRGPAPTINEDFGKVADKVMSEYRSQYVVPGSKEDMALRHAASKRRMASVLGQDVKRRGR